MSNILVTGGAGFIGAHVTRELAARGDQPVVIDDFNDRYNPALKEARAAALIPPTIPIERGDIRDRVFLENLFEKYQFETIIHLAAWAAVQTSIERPHIYTEVNLNGTVNLLEEARRHNIKHFVFASSSSVYGGRTNPPFRETDDVSRPLSPYAATKAAGEIMCATWYNLYQIPMSCLRFFTVYGPWGRPEMALFKFTEAIRTNQPVLMRGRNTKRDFTYIDDIVSGVIAAHDQPHDFAIYNLGNHDAVELPRFIQAIEQALQKKAIIEEVPLPVGDVPLTLADISHAQQAIQYQPKTSVEEGVTRFVHWYQDTYVPQFLA